jgi:putative ABC transport system permease protein
MPSPGELWRRLWFLLRRNQMERDLHEEMRQHLEWKTSEQIEAGIPAAQAGAAARRQIGNMTLQHERSREQWGFPRLESWLQDLRYGLRGLRKKPGFTSVAVLTLALGIGATTAIFSLVYTVILRPLPYPDSQRIYDIWTVVDFFPQFQLRGSLPDAEDIRSGTTAFERIAWYRPLSMNLTGAGEPAQLKALAVNTEFLPLLGAHPELGRGIETADQQFANSQVALLSNAVWQERFGADPKIVGKAISLGQKPYTVIGVMPASFSFEKLQIIIPLAPSPREPMHRGDHFLTVMAKLRPDVPPSEAEAQLKTVASRIAHDYPGDDKGLNLRMISMQDFLTRSAKSGLLLLLGAVGFLLLIACVNVSNLVLARGLQRTRELALRAALGASRPRIVRQLLLESLLLAFLGGVASLCVATAGIALFKKFGAGSIPRLNELGIDLTLGWFGFGISTLVGILCGLAPAWQSSRLDLNSAIKHRLANTSSAEPGGRRFSLRNILVVSEFSLALVLLAGSVLMGQSLTRLLRVETGMRSDHILTLELDLPSSRYGNDTAQITVTDQLLKAMEARPEFGEIAMSDTTLLEGMSSVATLSGDLAAGRDANINFRGVSAGFFETMGIPVLSGRPFNEHDVKGSQQVAVINESMAKHYWPGKNALGQSLHFGGGTDDSYQVIGIVADTRDVALRAEPAPEVFVALAQKAGAELHVLLRTSSDPTIIVPAVRKTIWSVDQNLPVTHVQTMEQVISESVSSERFRSVVLGSFATLGLVLTLIGIYGVIAYFVSRRTQEIGIRLALGATPRNVLQLVLGHACRLAVIGAVIGIAGALLLARFMKGELFNIEATDPATLIAATLVMVAVALAASFMPARRATKVDPMAALRSE